MLEGLAAGVKTVHVALGLLVCTATVWSLCSVAMLTWSLNMYLCIYTMSLLLNGYTEVIYNKYWNVFEAWKVLYCMHFEDGDSVN